MKVNKKRKVEDRNRLVRLVKKYPCLYNYKIPEYYQRQTVDKAWSQIAADMKMDNKTVREKWRNFRTVYIRHTKSDSISDLTDEMDFLLDYVKVGVPLRCAEGGDSLRAAPEITREQEGSDDDLRDEPDPDYVLQPKGPRRGDDEKESIKLVRLVKKYPCLYNYMIPEYTKRDAVEKAWSKIASEMKMTSSTVRHKWRNIRTVFLRHAKPGASPNLGQYYLTNELSFLLDYIKVAVPLKNTGSCDTSLNISEAPSIATTDNLLTKEDKSVEEPEQPTDLELFQEQISYHLVDQSASSQQIQLVNQELQAVGQLTSIPTTTPLSENDPRRLFFMSLLPDLDKMTAKQFRKFRKICLDFIDECQEDDD